MSVIRKKPYLESFIESLDEETLQSLKSVVNGSGSLQEASFSDLPEEAVAPVYFNLDKNDYKNGVLVKKEPTYVGTAIEPANHDYVLGTTQRVVINTNLKPEKVREIIDSVDLTFEGQDVFEFGILTGVTSSDVQGGLPLFEGSINILKANDNTVALAAQMGITVNKGEIVLLAGGDAKIPFLVDGQIIFIETEELAQTLIAYFYETEEIMLDLHKGWTSAVKAHPELWSTGGDEYYTQTLGLDDTEPIKELVSATDYEVIQNPSLLVAYHRFQDLQLYELDLAKHTYAKINEYCDINEFRRVLDKVAPSTDVYTENVFASDEIEFSTSSGDFGENAKARIREASTPTYSREVTIPYQRTQSSSTRTSYAIQVTPEQFELAFPVLYSMLDREAIPMVMYFPVGELFPDVIPVVFLHASKIMPEIPKNAKIQFFSRKLFYKEISVGETEETYGVVNNADVDIFFLASIDGETFEVENYQMTININYDESEDYAKVFGSTFDLKLLF